MNRKIAFLFMFFVAIFCSKNIYSQSLISNSPSTEKHAKSEKFEYYLTQLGTTTQADDIVTIFKARPGIVDAVVDLSIHKITIYSEQGMLERDVLEVIKYAGKQVISEKELTKYY